MSMILNLRAISDDRIKDLLENPDSVLHFLYGDFIEPPPPPQPQKNCGLMGFFGNLFGSKKSESSTTTVIEKPAETITSEPAETYDEIDLDKAWHGIHFMLTGEKGETDTTAGLLLAGQQIGDIDVGYGPARILNQHQVQQLYNHLSEISEDVFKEKYDPQKMNALEIYPDIFKPNRDHEENLEYFCEHFELLKDFITRTAQKNDGIIIFMN